MENGSTCTSACVLGGCAVVEEEEWQFARLIGGINAARTALGRCRHLNCTGALYEERGMLDPRALRRLLQGASRSYTVHICEASDVMLSADLVSTAFVRDTEVHITLRLEAMKAGSYSPETRRRILQEVEAAKLRGSASA